MIPHPGHKDGQDVHDRYQTIRDGRASGIAGNPYYGCETVQLG
jgi:asparagine synthase (glutamine-hydrolysing)